MKCEKKDLWKQKYVERKRFMEIEICGKKEISGNRDMWKIRFVPRVKFV